MLTCTLPQTGRPNQHARFEFAALEPRQHLSASQNAPDAFDISIVSNLQNDTQPIVQQSVNRYAKVPLPGGYTIFDSTRDYSIAARSSTDNVKPLRIDGLDYWPITPAGVRIYDQGFSESRVRASARAAATQSDIVVIDIENWSMDLRRVGHAALSEGIQRFRVLTDWIRDEVPSLKIGIYGFMSLTDHYASSQFLGVEQAAIDSANWYRATLPTYSNEFAKWQGSNEALQSLADQVDYMFPSLYTIGPDSAAWQQYAKSTISDTRRFGKPVIPFLWARYHDSVPQIGGSIMPSSLWQTELDTMAAYADGCAVWEGYHTLYSINDDWAEIVFNSGNNSGRPSASDTSETGDLPPAQALASNTKLTKSAGLTYERKSSLVADKKRLFGETVILN